MSNSIKDINFEHWYPDSPFNFTVTQPIPNKFPQLISILDHTDAHDAGAFRFSKEFVKIQIIHFTLNFKQLPI